jgi:hypothetical protein
MAVCVGAHDVMKNRARHVVIIENIFLLFFAGLGFLIIMGSSFFSPMILMAVSFKRFILLMNNTVLKAFNAYASDCGFIFAPVYLYI